MSPGAQDAHSEHRFRAELLGWLVAVAMIGGCAAGPEPSSEPPPAVYPRGWPAAIQSFRQYLNPLETPFEEMRRSYCLMVWATLGSDEDSMRGLLASTVLDVGEGVWLPREQFLEPLKSREPIGLSERKRAILFWDRIEGAQLSFLTAGQVRQRKLHAPTGMLPTDYLLVAAPSEGVAQQLFFRDVDGHWLIYAVGEGLPTRQAGSPGISQ